MLVPCDFLTCGEIKKHWPIKNVDLVLLGAAYTVDSIFKSLKFHQRLSYFRHHCQVTEGEDQQRVACALNRKYSYYQKHLIALLPDFSKS